MSPKMWETCGKVILRKMPLSYLRGIFLRCLAESNRSSRFCRPVPNRSAKAPYFALGLQIYAFILNLQPNGEYIFYSWHFTQIRLHFRKKHSETQVSRNQYITKTKVSKAPTFPFINNNISNSYIPLSTPRKVASPLDTPLPDDKYSLNDHKADSNDQGCGHDDQPVQRQRTQPRQKPPYQQLVNSCM